MDPRFDPRTLERIYDRIAQKASGPSEHLTKLFALVTRVVEAEQPASYADLAGVLEKHVLLPLDDLIEGLKTEDTPAKRAIRHQLPDLSFCAGGNESDDDFESIAATATSHPEIEDVPFPDEPPAGIDDDDEDGLRTYYSAPFNLDDRPAMQMDDVSGWREARLLPGDDLPEAVVYVHAHHAHRIELDGVASEAISTFPCEGEQQAVRLASYCRETGHFYRILIGETALPFFPNQLRFIGKIPKDLK